MSNNENKDSVIIGISSYYHDSAVALLINGEIVCAVQEERFTRKKHDDSFPINALKFIKDEYLLGSKKIDAVVFYDKPLLKFERLLEIYHNFVPSGYISFKNAMHVWVKDKLFIRGSIKKYFKDNFNDENIRETKFLFPEHHVSHAASAFFPSPFSESAILTIDGVGEWATTTICHGVGNKIEIKNEIHFPHSLGLLYSAFTYYCGFKVNSGEYKLMGLAPYGIKGEKVNLYKSKIYNNLISVKDDGSFYLSMKYFLFTTDLKMTNDELWIDLFGVPPRKPESEISQVYMDLALAIQEVTEEIVIKLAKTAKKITGSKNLVMAGGVALNCVANQKIVEEGIFDDVWVQPASGDAGGALGAALVGYHIYFKNKRKIISTIDSMNGSYLGPEYSDLDIIRMTREFNAVYEKYDNFDQLSDFVASLISKEKVIGWMQGKMEWGPRSLGNRSILGDARSPKMQKKINLEVKYREDFRPFAPAVLEEDVSLYFERNKPSPYMLFTPKVLKQRRKEFTQKDGELLTDRLYKARSDVPAITHLDYSARIQTVSKITNPRFWSLINSFKKITGNGIIINTSFNIRSEPIVMTPRDAYLCFMNSGIEYLVIGNYIFDKTKQPDIDKSKLFKSNELD